MTLRIKKHNSLSFPDVVQGVPGDWLSKLWPQQEEDNFKKPYTGTGNRM